MTVTVSVDVDENKDCVTRSGGETGPGRRWSEIWRKPVYLINSFGAWV
jgi:hypothetical protein